MASAWHGCHIAQNQLHYPFLLSQSVVSESLTTQCPGDHYQLTEVGFQDRIFLPSQTVRVQGSASLITLEFPFP